MSKSAILYELIKSRRAVYPSMYNGDIIEEDKIDLVLKSANWAPTHKMTEPWRFVVFDQTTKSDLAEYCSDWYKSSTPAEEFSEMKFNKIRNKIDLSSHIIAICMQRDPEHRIPEWEEVAAVSCAVQNMWLMCHSLSLGCYWSSSKAALEAGDFLKLKKGQKCLGWFYMGIPIDTLDLKGHRNDIKQKVTRFA